jgi:hypothetical protein
VPTEGSTEANRPFQDQGNISSKDPHDTSASGTAGSTPVTSPPFHDSQNLPAGTLLTVRLKDPITADTSSGNDSFQATLEQAVVVDGNILIPRGSNVVGRVQSAGTSKVKPSRGYVRLALETVHVAGLDVPVQTASLFARSPQNGSEGSPILLEKGHRLVFRLKEPVFVTFQRAQVDH